jgi:hypothetical protein
MPPPRFEARRRKELQRELTERARVWLPEWRRTEGGDFAAAIFEIAARLSSEVTERLDRVPEKAFRGFLDWLGIRGEAGRAARLPVVFTMAAGSEPVLAEAPVQFQALDVDPPVTFETDQSLTIVPGALASIVGADPANDAFYRPPAGFSVLEAPKAVPHRWLVKTDAPAGATRIQLEPELGPDDLPTIVHTASGQHYRVTKVEAGIVTIEPPVGQVETKGEASPAASLPLSEGDELTRLTAFAPFGDVERNRQEHELYIGSETLLNLKAAARIGISGGTGIPSEATWSFWGKRAPQDPPAWRALARVRGDGQFLDKPAGQVEILEIDGKKSRWLRATTSPSAGAEATLAQLKLTVNCASPAPRTCAPGDPPSTVPIEAIANTTPVVLDIPFYPLGREPRLFDAFYLASPEALSKKNAFVEICVQLADGTTEGYSAARLGAAATDPVMLFGVGKDGNLHRLTPEADAARPVRRQSPVRPPFSENGTTVIAAPSAALNRQRHARLSTVTRTKDGVSAALVAVTSKLDAWIWSQIAAPAGSRWYRAGTIWDPNDGETPVPNPDETAGSILMRDGTGLHLVGVFRGILYHVRLDDGWETKTVPPWTRVLPKPDARAAKEQWERIAPIFSLSDQGDDRLTGADISNGWLAADATGVALYREGLTRLELGEVSTSVAPLGVRLADDRLLVVVQQLAPGVVIADGASATAADLEVVAWMVKGAAGAELKVEKVAFDEGLEVIQSFDWQATSSDDPAIVFCAIDADDARVIAAWRPLSGQGDPPQDIPSSQSEDIDVLHGAAGVIDQRIVTSGPHAEIVVVGFHPERAQAIAVERAALQNAWLIKGTSAPFQVGEVIAIDDGEVRVAKLVATAPEASVGDYFFVHDFPRDLDHRGKLEIFGREGGQEFQGKVKKKGKGTYLELQDDDDLADEHKLVVVIDGNKLTQSEIQSISGAVGDPDPRVATLDPAVDASGLSTYFYVLRRTPRDITDHPAVNLAKLTADQIEALRGATLRFDGGAPIQEVTRLHPPAGAPQYAVLSRPWTLRPTGNPIAFAIENVYEPARILSEPRSVNPELSWEYWDGTAWWTIKGLVDGTGHLLFSGKVTFCVPASLQPTDVVGRTSHWIRARLVGGDYGRESVAVTSVEVPKTDPVETRQTIDRSLDDIVAPQIVSINLYYSVCCAALPDFVLTKDGGAIRDQSNANRTTDASLEAFVPLAQTIVRAGGGLPPTGAAESPATPQTDPAARALYLGFDEEITGDPISVLFLVDSGDHDAAFPLEVDVLRGRQFEPLTLVEDDTRGLNESGVLLLRLATPPQRAPLFGESRHWIRLRPNRRFDGSKWAPAIRAVYLNATWARASGTQTNEVLASSDGSPSQRVFLARLPVLYKSLKLRVREPLGEEEIAALRRLNPNVVLSELNRRPGSWVLWQEVADPADCAAGDRVFALDDEKGAITFGDGVHGKIPPPGLDSIVAEEYKQGGGAAANGVEAWSQINLITPLQGVESVAAPEGAAGGSDPQDAAAVLRFAPANLNNRRRVLTLRDLETLALQFSPDIAQVRALARGASVDLIVVTRGSDPTPPRKLQREILPYLLNLAPPLLAETDAIRVRPPILVVARISLRLEIASVERSGAVARDVAMRVTALLDPATGGLDGSGWRLGDLLAPEEVAAALDGVPDLETILGVSLERQMADGTSVPLPAQLHPEELLYLRRDSIEIDFALAESEAMA